MHLGIRRSAKGRLNGGGFGVDVREVDGSVCCRLRLGGDEDLGYDNSVRDGNAARFLSRDTDKLPLQGKNREIEHRTLSLAY